jgi:hypothetical protein
MSIEEHPALKVDEEAERSKRLADLRLRLEASPGGMRFLERLAQREREAMER